MDIVHFEDGDKFTLCGKELLKVKYATDLEGPALFLAEYFAAYPTRPCKPCLAEARTRHETVASVMVEMSPRERRFA